MDDFNQRQTFLLLEFIERYQCDDFGLNVLVQRLEGLRAAITIEELKERLEPLLWDLEGTNAYALEVSKGVLTLPQRKAVQAKLSQIVELTKQFQ